MLPERNEKDRLAKTLINCLKGMRINEALEQLEYARGYLCDFYELTPPCESVPVVGDTD